MRRNLTTVGWREWVQLPELGGGWLKAKVDTGARSSSLHAFDLEHFEQDGAPWVRFSIHPRQGTKKGGLRVEAPLLDTRSVKTSSGVSEPRPVIRTPLALGEVNRPIELTLTRRDEMGFRMLVGREALRGDFVVDPRRSFLAGGPDDDSATGRAPFEIAGVKVAPGQRQQVELPISRRATGTQVSLPVLVLHGQHDGPTVWMNAAIHGDEICGVEIIRRVLDRLDPQVLHGTVIAVPIVNVHGFVRGDRYLPDRRDLNRSFPGSTRGSLAQRIASLLLKEVVARCSFGVDLHTGSDGRSNLPQIRADLSDPTTEEMARTFGAPIMLHAKVRDGSLRAAATKAGATVLLFEGGEASRFDRAAIEVGTDGILRVFAAMGLVDPVVEPAPTTVRGDKTRWVRARRSGLAQLQCSLGDIVEKGAVLGVIHDSFGQRLSRFKSPATGTVIGLTMHPLVNRGDALVHVSAAPTEESS